MSNTLRLTAIITILAATVYGLELEDRISKRIESLEETNLSSKAALMDLILTIEDLKNKISEKPKVVYKTKIVTKVIKPEVDDPSVGVCGFPDRPDKVNRLMLGMGAGPNGLSVNSQQRTVKQKTGTILGIDYERKTNSGNVLGVGFGSNKSVMIKLGRDF